MSKSAKIALSIVEAAKKTGWNLHVRGDVLTIFKTFQRQSMNELVQCDMEYGSILCLLPRTSSGSDWGTECGGIGAMSALETGDFVMHRSGGSKRVLKELKKLGH